MLSVVVVELKRLDRMMYHSTESPTGQDYWYSNDINWNDLPTSSDDPCGNG